MVITDHGMPEMNGEEAALRIKKADPEIPILLISGWSRDLDRLEQQPGLFEEVLPKPLDLEELLRVIQRLAARSPGKNRNAASSKRPNR
jgi:CheY-like chemotaxis protein